MAAIKASTPHGAIDSKEVRPARLRIPPTREQLPLRNLPDCLLAAYDEVSHRAFSRFVARGSTPGSEIADWCAAEKDLFLPVAVDFADTETILYALAAVTRCRETRIEVALEDRWLLIWGHVDAEHECDGDAARASDREAAGLQLKWIDLAELHSVLKGSEDLREDCEVTAEPANEAERWGIANPVTARPFCVVELPVGVDISRTTAVLSDGLIALRMPKLGSESSGLAASQS
jgi:HSP20 family molecular chaperone IbpA